MTRSGGSAIDAFLHDLKYALRGMRQSPGVATAIVLSLALGIGGSTAIFSTVDAVLFRPLIARRPSELVRIVAIEGNRGPSNMSYPAFDDFRQGDHGLAGLAAFSEGATVNFVTDGRPETASASLVTGNFFDVMGVTARLGRLLSPADDRTPGNPVLVLSDAFFTRRFQGDAAALGTSVRVNETAFTIIGVAPPRFTGATLESAPDLWAPMAMAAQTLPAFGSDTLLSRGFGWLGAIGRLADGVPAVQAEARLRAIRKRSNADLVERDRDPLPALVPAENAALDLDSKRSAVRLSWILLGAVGLVLVIAGSVVAGLLLVRAERRRKEVAIRLAIGATRARIVRQLLVESVLLSSVGAALGLAIASGGARFLMSRVAGQFSIPLGAAAPVLSSRVLLFASALGILTGLVFGLAPARNAGAFDLVRSLKGEGGNVRGTSVPIRNVFVVVELALAVVLLFGAGLLLRTLLVVNAVDPGFRVDGALVAPMDLARQGTTRAAGAQVWERLLESVRSVPGVRSAALGRVVPVHAGGMRLTVRVEGAPRDETVDFDVVTPRFFETLGIPLVAGRALAESDGAKAPAVGVVNEALARLLWPGESAVGKRLGKSGALRNGLEIVGVVKNARFHSLRAETPPMLFTPLAQFYMSGMTLVVRTEGAPASLEAAIRESVAKVDANLPLFEMRTLREHLGVTLAEERVVSTLVLLFGSLALVLAVAGLFSLVSYVTESRAKEFAVRVALGASREQVLGLVLSQGGRLVGAGLVIGMGGALALGRILGGLLWGVAPSDPTTFVLVTLVLALSGLLACSLPAHRAAGVDPVLALRSE